MFDAWEDSTLKNSKSAPTPSVVRFVPAAEIPPKQNVAPEKQQPEKQQPENQLQMQPDINLHIKAQQAKLESDKREELLTRQNAELILKCEEQALLQKYIVYGAGIVCLLLLVLIFQTHSRLHYTTECLLWYLRSSR